jgi:hypothetical protein
LHNKSFLVVIRSDTRSGTRLLLRAAMSTFCPLY